MPTLPPGGIQAWWGQSLHVTSASPRPQSPCMWRKQVESLFATRRSHSCLWISWTSSSTELISSSMSWNMAEQWQGWSSLMRRHSLSTQSTTARMTTLWASRTTWTSWMSFGLFPRPSILPAWWCLVPLLPMVHTWTQSGTGSRQRTTLRSSMTKCFLRLWRYLGSQDSSSSRMELQQTWPRLSRSGR